MTKYTSPFGQVIYLTVCKWQSRYVRLALQLVREKERGEESPLAPWLGCLPTPADFADLPLYWTPAERAALQYPPLEAALDSQVKYTPLSTRTAVEAALFSF